MNLTANGVWDEYTIQFDDADAETVMAYKWRVHEPPNRRTRYAVTAVKKPDGRWTTLRMHVLLTGQTGMDHINRDGLDNRRSNLRPATRSQQGANQPPRAGSSQYKGVCYDKSRRKWVAGFVLDHVRQNLGRFNTEIEAARAYDAGALATWGDFALLNFPEEALSRSSAA